jgi:hypothetical protein
MSVKLNDFATGVTVAETDHVVGYTTTSAGGERKWTLASLRNSLITGAATTIDTENLTTSRAIISDTNGKITASAITSTELAQLGGIKTNVTIQTQIDAKGSGTVTRVTGSGPISVTSDTTTPVVSIAAATTSADGVMSSGDKSRLDDASSVNGLVKCNGSGNFSAAIAGIDYLTGASNIVKAYGTVYWSGNNRSTDPTATFQWIESNNIASITWVKRGVYKLTFSNPMANKRYSVVGSVNLPIDITSSPYTTLGNWYDSGSGRDSMAGNENVALFTNKETTYFYACFHSNETTTADFENTNGFSFIVI